VDSGQPLMALESRSGFVSPPALSVSGSMLAVAERTSESGVRVRRVDLGLARELAPVSIAGELVELALGPEGRFLATLDRENVVRIWESDSGRLMAQLAHDHGLARLLFDRSGRWLATVDQAGMARVWPLAGAEDAEDFDGGMRPIVALSVYDSDSLSFSADGEMLLLQTRARSYELLALPGGAALMPPLRHSGEMGIAAMPAATQSAFASAFDKAGEHILTGRGTPSARVWKILPAMDAPGAARFAVGGAGVLAINPGSYQLARGDDLGAVDFLDRGQPWSPVIPTAQIAGHAGPVTALAYSPDGSRLVSVGGDGSVLLWDAAERQLAGERFHHGSGEVFSAAIGPDNRLIVTGGQLGARLWDGISGEPGPVLGPGRQIIDVDISADGLQVATLTRDAIEFWRADNGEMIWSEPLPGPPVSMSLRAEPSQLAIALADGRLLLWDRAPDGQPALLAINGPALAMDYTSSGGLLLQTGEWMHLLSVDGERRPVASSMLPGLVPAGAWQAQSTDGETIAVASRSGAHEFGLGILNLSKPSEPPAPEILAREEDVWLARLKLRFDTSGEVVPEFRGARQAPAVAPLPTVPSSPSRETVSPNQR